jgi:hypothetical protein
VGEIAVSAAASKKPALSLRAKEIQNAPDVNLATTNTHPVVLVVGAEMDENPAFDVFGTETLGLPLIPLVKSDGRRLDVACVMCLPLPDKSCQYPIGSPFDVAAVVPLLF